MTPLLLITTSRSTMRCAIGQSLMEPRALNCEAAMTSLDLVPLAELPVRMLSAGQKRRGSLARTMASGAAIWLLDEPYNGL